jgi:uncharacterized protein (TIGR02145 family)
MIKGNVMLLAVVLALTGLTSCRTNSVKDIEGNVYKTVTIGTQVWMAENLRTTKYNDGTAIQVITDNDQWSKLTTAAYSWYNNDSTVTKKEYGALYNWNAVSTNKLCPAGWHVPSDAEWVTLTTFLEGFGIAGGKLKEKGTVHWKSPNKEANNKSGFTALPGGYRSYEGIFNSIGISGYWWCSTPYNEGSKLFWYLQYKFGNIYKSRSENSCGFSVRCVRDH